MTETTSEVQGTLGKKPMEYEEEDIETPDIHSATVKILRAPKEDYEVYVKFEEKPTKGEVLGWFFYGLCSHFIHTVLIPVVFPLIISQINLPKQQPTSDWWTNSRGLNCLQRETQLFGALTSPRIKVNNNLHFSALEWTSISWVLGLIIAAPILSTISVSLDYGRNQLLIAAAATAAGALFCLPAGFFKTTWIFPPYIAAIIAASTVCVATHTRHLGLMIRGFIGSAIRKTQFPNRRAIGGWISLYATAAGCFGSALISAFTYHMLRHSDGFLSLWIVSIFSGLIWAAGIVHIFIGNRPGADVISSSNSLSHFISIFNYPHAAGSLAGVFLSSFATMCLFTGGVLHLVGQLCLKPEHLLFLWLTYFLFPLLSLPLARPLQQLIRADAVKMQILGFLLSAFTAGIGFYYRHENWKNEHVLVLAAVQSTATGFLHAFGRVLLIDCSPAGKEGTFAAWFSWVRALGTCTGFAVASAGPGNINRSFGVAFCTAMVGTVVLIFGNISNFGGAIAAGNVREDSENNEKDSPVHGFESGIKGKAPETIETPYEEKVEVV